MDIDIVTLSAFVLSIIGAIGAVINQLHIRQCNVCCASSDCQDTKNKTGSTSTLNTTPTPLSPEQVAHLMYAPFLPPKDSTTL